MTGAVTPVPPNWERLKDALLALSLVNLCFISTWFALIFDTDKGYFNKLRVMPPSLWALLVNYLWATLLAWFAIRVLRRYQNRWLHLALHLLFFALLLAPLDFLQVNIASLNKLRVGPLLHNPVGLAACLVVFAAVVWQHRRVAFVLASIVGILSPFALLILIHVALLLLGVLHVAQHSDEPVLASQGAVAQERPRVLWIIFDETDYRLAFEQRPSGFRLPEFDRLCSESLSATNAHSPADYTFLSMPGLISGRQFSAAKVRNSSDLTVTLAENGKEVRWSELPSIFDAARKLGVNTALCGWYHPYDRVLGRCLNFCKWYPFPTFEPARAATFGQALLREILCVAGPLDRKLLFAQLQQKTLQESLLLGTNTNYGLTLLHIPLPHLPGLYIPAEDRLSIWHPPGYQLSPQAYFDNLVLVDRWLGKLRRNLETAGQWDRTWLIISSDHSFRESARYDGRRDLRVPFIVKAPDHNRCLTYSPRLDTVITHDLILAILRGEILSQEQLSPWLQIHQPALKVALSFPQAAQ